MKSLISRALGLVALLAATASLPTHAADRPNIVFAFADDWGRHASAYAQLDGPGTVNDAIQTPNFDRIAREGALFRHAFVSAPSCTPCRSALLSGQHFWRTGRGAILQGAIWNPEIPAYPLLLNDNGYHIGETYKVWSPGSPNDAPYGGGKFGYEKAGNRFNQFSQQVTKMVADGVPREEAKQTLYDQVAANFDAFLSARDGDKPFCYWFGPTNVHRKWVRGSGKALWDIDPDSLEGKMPPFLPDVPEVREDLADYFGEAQAFDAALGVLIAKLEAAGELENTMIVVSGDHGAPGFTHGKCNLYDFGTSVPLAIRAPGIQGGRVIDNLTSLTSLAPTFLEAAGVAVPDTMTGQSLLPLLRSDGGSRIDPGENYVLTGRERHVESANDDFLPYPQRAIRTAEYLFVINFEPDRWPMGAPYGLHDDGKDEFSEEQFTEETRVTLRDMDASPTKAWLITHRDDPKWRRYYDMAFAKRPREELYILSDDLHQVTNVAGDERYADIQSELRDKLMAELKRTGDPRVIDGGKFFETPPMAGPIEGRRR